MRWTIWRQREPRRRPLAAPRDARIARRLDIDVKEVEGHIAATLIALRRALKEFD